MGNNHPMSLHTKALNHIFPCHRITYFIEHPPRLCRRKGRDDSPISDFPAIEIKISICHPPKQQGPGGKTLTTCTRLYPWEKHSFLVVEQGVQSPKSVKHRSPKQFVLFFFFEIKSIKIYNYRHQGVATHLHHQFVLKSLFWFFGFFHQKILHAHCGRL